MNKKLPSFQNSILFDLALTHRSYTNENPTINADNERLEFLGDAVLGFVIAEMLYTNYPQLKEGQLTHLRSRLVDEKQLGKLGKELGLGKLMHLGKGTEKDGGRENPSLLNDTFEATLGAYFLDSGIEAVRRYILEIFQPLAETLINSKKEGHNPNRKTTNFIDSKNRFQQWALAKYQVKPEYQIIEESKLDSEKKFTAQVLVLGKVYGIGQGRRKQEAEKQAAEIAMKNLEADLF